MHLHRLPSLSALAVAAANSGNPLLQMRGNAGSHDMGLGTETLQALKAATRPGSSVPIPRWALALLLGRVGALQKGVQLCCGSALSARVCSAGRLTWPQPTLHL